MKIFLFDRFKIPGGIRAIAGRLLLFVFLLSLSPGRLSRAARSETPATFTVVVLPDTQNYIQNLRRIANRQMFREQVDWIVANRRSRNIVYVTQLGDLSQSINMAKGGHEETTARAISEERFRACDTIMRPLDAAGIPYGIAVGNHDQFPLAGDASGSSTALFHKWFVNQGGTRSRFDGKPWFGGTREAGNYDDHYDRFRAGGKAWIVIYLEFDDDQVNNTADDEARNGWALQLLKKYADHTAIVVTHNAGKLKQKAFSKQGQLIYDALKDQPNLVMLLGGHIANLNGDVNYFRTDRGALPPVRTYISDFQSLSPDGTTASVNGGNGYLRVMQFSVKENRVRVSTFSPYLEKRGQPNQFAGKGAHQFEKPIFGGAG
ncbi:hypothetical protein C7T94_04175 [Pedobacter yulinensis]|uniref:Uncharacterized protein n=1 Tax=Pedobacter yulinensis TaxID=2126353 RepID=A0A2T3HNB5_9SPHI|nr:metallophosphoesterase [Pedobacter yulinensis]PST83948.1 hypothetical protein C7T94_04175 [Pedobacter yulinensis]